MGKKVCIFTDQHLSTNPRVWKEADALASEGYEVSIVTIATSAEKRKEDQTILSNIDSSIRYIESYSTITGEVPIVKKLKYKMYTLAAVLLKKVGIETIYLLAKNPGEIYIKALQEQADLYIGHVDCSLYVGKKLIQAGKRVAFDFEDWYSHDYINSRRPVELLKSLERYAMLHSKYIACPSHAMAEALQRYYNSSQRPAVIYNTFPEDRPVSAVCNTQDIVSLVWFSQTVGAGRGLEEFISSLHSVNTPVKLVLIGDCKQDYAQELNKIFPSDMGHKLELIPPVSHNELHVLLGRYDIGLALERIYPKSRNKTVTNKILQYLQAGIKVLATDTEGQREVATQLPGYITLLDASDNSGWGEGLTTLIEKKADKQALVPQYNAVFSWTIQKQKILQLVKDAIQ